jgi:hypothetical protein
MFDVIGEFNGVEDWIDTVDTEDDAKAMIEDLKTERGAAWKFWYEKQ